MMIPLGSTNPIFICEDIVDPLCVARAINQQAAAFVVLLCFLGPLLAAFTCAGLYVHNIENDL